MSREVRHIGVKGYKSIESVELEPGRVTVLVGANGAGKSNFIEAVELLGRIADEELALEVGRRGGAATLLRAGAKGNASISLRLEARANSLTNVYEAVLVPSRRGELVFRRELIEFHDHDRFGRPWTEELGMGHRETLLPEAEKTGPLGLGGVAGHTLRILRGCRVYHFHDTTPGAPVKQPGYASDAETLHPDANNLAAFLLRLRGDHPDEYRKIVRTVRSVAPFFRDFVLSEDASKRVSLRWTQIGSETVLPADALSDGTLRFICLSTLLLQPKPPALLVLDEPELGLHPFALTVLAELFRSASERSQVIAATQSVTFLDQFSFDELVVTERVEGATALRRPDPEALAAWLEEYSPAEL
ncbi:AAA family ATPase [Streptomyces alkaliphilus]|uniref:AAA family ATPase n=1 Tax=Streptomyces alkaliphilus TaxID=1472722 RepID=UPI00117DD7B5|nr:AAA family ATPase [Streptomyces alkaliphilus]MQS09357.1 AAA family ATPase [Streptomyces alkaliphilus]